MSNNEYLRNKTLGGIFWKGLERVLAQVVSTVVSIILARLLLPEDYGIVSIVLIFFSFCNIFITSGLSTALIQKKEADSLDYSTTLYANFAFATTLYLILFFCAPFIEKLFNQNDLTIVLRIMGIMLFVNGYKSIVSAKISSDLQFRKFFFSTLIGTVVSAVVGIVMAVNDCGVWALVAQQMTNSVVDALVLTITTKLQISFSFSIRRFANLFKYGGKLIVSGLINETYNQITPLVIGLRFSSAELAFYAKGRMYPQLISSTANDTLSSSLFPVMSKAQDDKDLILKMTRRFMQMSSFFVFPLMIGFLAVSESFVLVVLTEKWLPIVPYLIIFCVAYMFSPIQTGNLQAIKAIGKSNVFLLLEVIKKTLYTAILVCFIIFIKDPVYLAVSAIITSLLASLINSFPNKKLLNYGYKKQFLDLAPNLITAVIMGCIVYFMKYIQINNIVLLILQVFVGIIVYFLLNYLIKNKSLAYLIDLFKTVTSRKKTEAHNE